MVALPSLATATAIGQADATSREWNKPVPPFRIAGNLYYVGATEICSYSNHDAEGPYPARWRICRNRPANRAKHRAAWVQA